MIIILIRTIILYFLVLCSLRIMGKSELSKLQPFEVVIILMISELATLSMEDTSFPLINAIVAICSIVCIQCIMSYILLKNNKLRKFACGTPSILINKGHLVENELNRLRISMDDLNEQLRLKDYSVITDIEYAILETNGEISIIPKPDKRKVTLSDINKHCTYEGLATSVIMNGKILDYNLSKINLNVDWLKNELEKISIYTIDEVFFCCVFENNKIFAQKKEKE